MMDANNQPQGASMTLSPQARFPIIPEAAARDAAILTVVRASAASRTSASAHRRLLQEKAHDIADFEHFQRLCLGDLRQAFTEDRIHGTRTLKHRRLTWLTLFRYFAAHTHLHQGVAITALDRQGNYACTLTEPTPAVESDWDKLVRLAKPFGIHERELTALWTAKQGRRA